MLPHILALDPIVHVSHTRRVCAFLSPCSKVSLLLMLRSRRALCQQDVQPESSKLHVQLDWMFPAAQHCNGFSPMLSR